ncbi:MAG: CCA tRNA nucleotidyltransferase [Nitrospiria bacterium]
MSCSLENLRGQVADIRRSLPFLPALEAAFPKGEVYLVGGAVRDLLLNRGTKDYDFLVRHVPSPALHEFLKVHGKVSWVGKNFGVYKFYPKGGPGRGEAGEAIDVALPRTEESFSGAGSQDGGYKDFEVKTDPELQVEEDLQRRDFTVNAMAVDIKRGHLMDPYGGLSDLKAECLRAVGDPVLRFKEDSSRLLRGLRFACQFGFSFEKKSWAALGDCIDQLNAKGAGGAFIVPRETIAKEFLKAMVADPVLGFDLWDSSGAFRVLIPELLPMKGCPQPKKYHSEGDVWTHTRLALSHLKSQAFRDEFSSDGDAEIVLAVLFHDIAKPVTIQTPEKDGSDRIRFNHHDRIGARMAREIVLRLKLSSMPKGSRYYVDGDALGWLIGNHLLLVQGEIDRMRAATLEKYFMNPRRPSRELMQLIFCDGSAAIPASGEPKLLHYHQVKERIAHIQALSAERAKVPRPLLTGNDVMEALQIPSGPEIGKLLALVREEQLSGRISSREEALVFLQRQNKRSRVNNGPA